MAGKTTTNISGDNSGAESNGTDGSHIGNSDVRRRAVRTFGSPVGVKKQKMLALAKGRCSALASAVEAMGLAPNKSTVNRKSTGRMATSMRPIENVGLPDAEKKQRFKKILDEMEQDDEPIDSTTNNDLADGTEEALPIIMTRIPCPI